MSLRFVLKKLFTIPRPPSVMFMIRPPSTAHKVGVVDSKFGLFSSNLHEYSYGGGFIDSFKKGLTDRNNINNKEEEVFDKGFISHYTENDCLSLVEVSRMPEELNDRFLTFLYSFIDTVYPLSPTRKFARYLNWVENNYSFSPCTSHVWDVKETTEDVFLLRKMPRPAAVGDDVEVSVQQHTPSTHKPIYREKYYTPVHERFGYIRLFRRMLIPSADLLIDVKGSQDNNYVKPFAIKIALPGKIYKTNGIKIHKNTDLLRVVIPKAKANKVTHFDFLFLRR